MLNKSFWVIYFHFNIFSEKKAKKKNRCYNFHFWVFENVSQNGPFHTTGESMSTPFVIVGDEAFPLNKHLMKPYAKIELDDLKKIFNYRLSRFRSCSENVFGIIAA